MPARPREQLLPRGVEVIGMKAVVQERYGSAEVLEFGEVLKPTIGDGEVLVSVVAAGVDRGAWHYMAGEPYLMRILGFGFHAPKSRVPGTNIAGHVEQVGSNVTRFKVGDAVFGTCRGAWAEYAVASEQKICLKPASLTFEEAAVVPYGAYASWQAVHDHGRVQAGESVLAIGATGAVGSFAVQFAKAVGAEVTAGCGPRSVDDAKSLGADRVLDYAPEDFAAGPHRYDAVIDVFGRSSVSRLRHVLKRNGRLVIAGGEGDRWIGGIQRQLWATMLSAFVSQRLRAFVVKENRECLLKIIELIEAGKAYPVVGRTYSFIDAPSAARALVEGAPQGRIALRMKADASERVAWGPGARRPPWALPSGTGSAGRDERSGPTRCRPCDGIRGRRPTA